MKSLNSNDIADIATVIKRYLILSVLNFIFIAVVTVQFRNSMTPLIVGSASSVLCLRSLIAVIGIKKSIGIFIEEYNFRETYCEGVWFRKKCVLPLDDALAFIKYETGNQFRKPLLMLCVEVIAIITSIFPVVFFGNHILPVIIICGIQFAACVMMARVTMRMNIIAQGLTTKYVWLNKSELFVDFDTIIGA